LAVFRREEIAAFQRLIPKERKEGVNLNMATKEKMNKNIMSERDSREKDI